MGFLTVVMCAMLYVLPNIDGDFLAAVLTMPEWLFQETQVDVEEDVVLRDGKLNIELPEGIGETDLEIVNDYIGHTVYVRFAKAVDNYTQNYIIQGNSEHLSRLSYYKDGEEGVLEIKLDEACEYIQSYEDGYLRLEFKELHEVYEKVVVIDAGHGGSHYGAVKKDIHEKELNLQIVLKLKELLDQVDENKVKVFYTRLEDENPSLADRAEMANELKADLFISVHNNASASGKFTDLNGTMVLYSPDKYDDSSKRLAQICLDNVTASAGSKNLGLVEADSIYIIRTSEVPVALIEVGYMTNIVELTKLATEEYQEKVAQGIFNGIMQAFEEGF